MLINVSETAEILKFNEKFFWKIDNLFKLFFKISKEHKYNLHFTYEKDCTFFWPKVTGTFISN